MNLIENSSFSIPTEVFGDKIPVETQENFVKGVYSSVDEATAHELDRLRKEDGIIPACKSGCCKCCQYHIIMNIAEAHTLAQYVRREFSVAQIRDLRIRTQQWHEWDNSRPGRYPSASIDKQADIQGYDYSCPLLVNNECSTYPVRPVVCRTHFVCSHSLGFCMANEPESTQNAPMVLKSVVNATSSFSMEIREYIENAGFDFSRSIMLLPHWLAVEMDWDFTITR